MLLFPNRFVATVPVCQTIKPEPRYLKETLTTQLMNYIDTKLLILGLAIFVLVFLITRYRKKKTYLPLLLAFVLSAAWTSYFRYQYVDANWFLFGRINVYPIVLWTIGLTSLQLVSNELPKRNRLGVLIVLYLFCLMLFELIGYYLLNVRLATQYTSLLNLGIIHAPVPMKIFYIFAGPLYFLVLDRLERRRS